VSASVLLVVGLVGGLGAIGRFALDGAVAGRLGRRFPYGTLAVNLSGSLALGVLVGASVRGDGYEIVGTGLLGAYTTFSTWALESHRLGEDGQLRSGVLNFALSVVLGVVVAWVGRQLGGSL
jgi:fluoride exporter